MHLKRFFIALTILLSTTGGFAADQYAAKRQALLDEIKLNAKQTSFATGKATISKPVLDALQNVPRHQFVRPQDQKHAYENRPLRIGHGQTISQPYIVALMTDLINLKKDQTVLEVGTGSGYQAAILGAIAKSVYTIEIIEPLAMQAQKRLAQLGYNNIKVRAGDGYFGWEDAGPFDAIVVTAAASHVPPPLIKQLKPGGKMIIPVGSQFFTQQLMLIEKQLNNRVVSKQILPVVFVPLTGKH